MGPRRRNGGAATTGHGATRLEDGAAVSVSGAFTS